MTMIYFWREFIFSFFVLFSENVFEIRTWFSILSWYEWRNKVAWPSPFVATLFLPYDTIGVRQNENRKLVVSVLIFLFLHWWRALLQHEKKMNVLCLKLRNRHAVWHPTNVNSSASTFIDGDVFLQSDSSSASNHQHSHNIRNGTIKNFCSRVKLKSPT